MKKIVIITAVLLSVCICAGVLYSKEIAYSVINIDKVTRYNEDRIAFQHIEADIEGFYDNSLSNLLIIDKGNMYLLKDGYDDPQEGKKMWKAYTIARRDYATLWKNPVNSSPDYIRITERRIERMLNVTEEFVNKNFGDFYRRVRDAFLTRHANVFRSLMVISDDSVLVVERKVISPMIITRDQELKEEKFSTVVSARTIDDTHYYAEDADGDGITETFHVNIPDGFIWGYKSGPNIIFIHKNKSEDIKAIIGKLAHEAYFGTEAGERVIMKNFPPTTDIIKEHRLDQNPLAQVEKEKPAPGGN